MGINLTNVDLLQGLINDYRKLSYEDEISLDLLRRMTIMMIKNMFGPSSEYITDFNSVQLRPYDRRAATSIQRQMWSIGINRIINIIYTMIEEIKTFDNRDEIKDINKIRLNNRVFIVHGHDIEMRESVARVLKQLYFEVVILDEQPNSLKTILEKLLEYSDVSLAIILFSPDDIGCKADEDIDNLKPRARQNVIFEFGFFLGKMDRARIILLYREEDEFEIPSDLNGVSYILYDRRRAWILPFAKEIRSLGFEVDLNAL